LPQTSQPRTLSEVTVTEAPTLFTAWESFYVIVGSSGAALTGLQFVVMALIAGAQFKGAKDTVNAFGTPTVFHFCMVLATAAILTAPWQRALIPGVILTLGGLVGIAYAGIVTARARRQRAYQPVFEDWVWHSVLPIGAYALMLGGALATTGGPGRGLFAIGASTLLLLFIGIHNAWDSIAYVATEELAPKPPASSDAP